jgi:phosphonate transport system ATP-binding protein
MPAVSVEKLSKRFGKTQALCAVDFVVEPGEMVALIGASGSGKSTLIRHVAGLERGDGEASRITVHDRVMQHGGKLSAEARVMRREVGVVFQQFNLVNRLPVLTNVLIGCLGRIPAWRGTFGWFTRDEQLGAMQALARVGIAERARQRSSTLSGGQQQRAAIARALVQGARILLADEPIASLDPASARRVMETMAEINRVDGITVVVSLHQVEYARLYCPRTIALKAGEIAFDGPSEALTNDFLREIYGAASEELVLPSAPIAIRPSRSSVATAHGLATT